VLVDGKFGDVGVPDLSAGNIWHFGAPGTGGPLVLSSADRRHAGRPSCDRSAREEQEEAARLATCPRWRCGRDRRVLFIFGVSTPPVGP